MGLYLLTRHGQSTLNPAGIVNADPSVEAPITQAGREETERVGRRVQVIPTATVFLFADAALARAAAQIDRLTA